VSRKIDQYFLSIAAAALAPASAAHPARRVSKERRKIHVVSAQNGIRTALALNLSA